MKLKRGSAALYVMVMLVIMTTITLAYADLSKDAYTNETRREQNVMARLAFDGAALKSAYDAGMNRVAVTSSNLETVGHYSCVVNMSDNSSNLGHSVSISSTMTLGGRSFIDARTTALKMPLSQFFYCLASETTANFGKTLITGASGANGDIYCAGDISFHPGTTINGDIEATGSVDSAHETCTGLVSSSVRAIPLPSITPGNYSSLSLLSLILLILGNNVNGMSFATPYSVAYLSGDASIQGTFSGKGVLFVNGNINISGPMYYSSPTDELLVLSTGNINVQSAATSIVGYFYAQNQFQAGKDLTLTRGCIVANIFNIGGNFTATYDPFIWNTPGAASNMKIPGFWP